MYAVWVSNQSHETNLIYVLNGGTGGPNNELYTTNRPINTTTSSTMPTKSGFSFMCWKDINNTSYYSGVTSINVNLGDTLVLYANFY